MKKILVVFLLTFFFVSFTHNVFAAATPAFSDTTYPSMGDVINTKNNNTSQSLEKWVAGVQDEKGMWVQRGMLQSIIDGLNCQLIGCPPTGASASLVPGGVLGFSTKMVAAMFTPTISTKQYVAFTLENILGRSAYAQNLNQGSVGLSPIISIWGTVRNISYIFSVIVMVAIGFMIMFRHKMDPQTVVSIESALPKIILSLLLITFSYAISSLMIDFSNVITILLANSFSSFHNAAGFEAWLQAMMGTGASVSIFQALFDIGNPAVANLGNPIQGVISNLAGAIANAIPGFAGLASSMATFILSITLIGALFKTFFALLSAYINIIFLTIISPIVFLSSALPGKSGTAGEWLKDMLSNVLVFPVLFIFLFIGAIISQGSVGTAWQIQLDVVNFTDPWIPFGIGGLSPVPGQLVKYLIGFGVVMTAPSIPGIVKEFLHSKESAFGASTAQSLQGSLQKIPIIGSFLG